VVEVVVDVIVVHVVDVAVVVVLVVVVMIFSFKHTSALCLWCPTRLVCAGK
jgi:hypothetical protein